MAGFIARMPYYIRHYRTYLILLTTPPPAGEGHLFDSQPTLPRDGRMHPELVGVDEPIDASVSIIIPTLNAGFEFTWLMRKLRAQRGLRQLEVVIVDSGSNDDTVAYAREAGCTIVEILPEAFSHSFARNSGAEVAQGDYLLFMVQDAYPIGDYWVYGMLRYLLDHAEANMAAVSCAEYSRSDSDMMYDWMINTHYSFLGCLERDRIGEFKGNNHTLLRSYGQLSDVACLIPKEVFGRYRYRGDYAEDLDLGIRLIKDGHRVAMLASVKVVHSHNRAAYYYLKRSFVDTVYLVGLFDDYAYPHVESVPGLIAGIVSTAAYLSDWLQSLDESDCSKHMGDELSDWIRDWRRRFVEVRSSSPSRLGEARLDAYIDSLSARYLVAGWQRDGAARREARSFLDAFLARLEHFNAFAGSVYRGQDELLRRGLRDAVFKNFAATVGSTLGYMYMDLTQTTGASREMAETIKNELKVGI
ncbi:MAG: glycosyltransferase family 2 protein [Sulfuricella sp.]